MTPRPTPEQLHWQALEFGMFCHFGINTFYNKEWSDGSLDPAAFNPQHLNPRQWVSTAQAAGMHYLILTAKHHDGFCLWPTETTDYSVRASPYRAGFGDVVEETAVACREAGMSFGLYLSPWDRHEGCYYDPPAYDRFYIRQLTELCTRYGPLAELWFDGAGSEGRVYDWEAIMAVVDRHQPQAVIFNMGRPTIRWIGNEDGLAADPNYYAVPLPQLDGTTELRYCPPECDVAIRANWFWQDDDLPTLKSLEHLLGIYYRSVGLGANLLLNVPPDRNGLLDAHDAARLLELGAEVRRRFAEPIHAQVQHTDSQIVVDFGADRIIDHLELHEDLSTGQQIDGYTLLDEQDRVLAEGHTIGWRRILPMPVRRLRRVQLHVRTAGARLRAVLGYHTGYERLPELGGLVDDYARSARVD